MLPDRSQRHNGLPGHRVQGGNVLGGPCDGATVTSDLKTKFKNKSKNNIINGVPDICKIYLLH